MSTAPHLETRKAGQASSSSSWNEETREVDVIWSAGGDVVRRSWEEGGRYVERLSMQPGAVDLSRLNAGASLLDAHDAWSMSSRIGVVVPGSAKVAGGLGTARVQLLRNAGGEELADACRQGAGFLLSVGYRVEATERDEGDGTSLPIITATRWTPLEVSAVPIPADPAARTRSAAPHERNRRMDPDDLLEAPDLRSRPPAGRPTAGTAEDERRRQSDIRAIAKRAGIDPDPALDSGLSVEAFRERAYDVMIGRQEAASQFPHAGTRGGGGADRRDEYVEEVKDILLGRSGPRDGNAILRSFAADNGIDTRSANDAQLSRLAFSRGTAIDGYWSDIARRGMHTTGDFIHLVDQAAQRAALEIFAKNPTALKVFSRKKNAANFKPQSFIRPSDAPELLKVNEHGEIKSGTFSEEEHSFKIDSYARMVALSFQLQVNDNLNLLGEMIQSFSTKGIELEANLFALLLVSNGGRGVKLKDGLPLFDEAHRNMSSPGPLSGISISTVSEAVYALRTQQDMQGHRVSSAPKTLLVGPEMEVHARQFVATIAATKPEDVNPFSYLEVVVEERLVGPGWYVIADPVSRPTFVHGYLEGHEEGPVVQSQEGWRVLGTEYRALMHFGAGIHDYRAIFYSPGQ